MVISQGLNEASETSVCALSPAVIWHDLECGSYRADLALWRELAATVEDPVLDVGAGTGRVTLDLAQGGHRVIALDRDQRLLDELGRRTIGLNVQSLCADARALELAQKQISLCLVPMQTIQLFGGSRQRVAFLRRAKAHLRPGGLLACAIVTDLESFDSVKDLAPSPDVIRLGSALYVSRPTKVRVLRRRIAIERERRIIQSARKEICEHSVVQLDRLSVRRLQREAAAVGFSHEESRQIPFTQEHVGSTVVMLRA